MESFDPQIGEKYGMVNSKPRFFKECIITIVPSHKTEGSETTYQRTQSRSIALFVMMMFLSFCCILLKMQVHAWVRAVL